MRRLDWAGVRAAFLARTRRERAMLIGAAVAVWVLAGWLLWIQPAASRLKHLEQEINERTADMQHLQPSLVALLTRPGDPDAGRRAQIERLRRQIADAGADFGSLERSLVVPRDMGRLVEGLLRQHGGLQLLAWRSLPVTPLSELLATPRAGAAAAVPARAVARGAAPVGETDGDPGAESWLYLHGIEITVGGNYADMQSWLDQVERLPRHLYWGPLGVDAKAWPATVMTVTLYTVSLERTWWSL